MAKESLFNILSRQPWWITLLVAFGLFWVAYAIFPPVAPFVALPFLLLAVYIGIVQLRRGPVVDPGERLAALRAMPWEVFSAEVTRAYRKQGYSVLPPDGRGYDFRLVKDARTSLLQCRRWKVNQVGEAPLRELAQAVDREEASRGICLAAGDFSAPARKFASGEPLVLVSGVELARLLPPRRKTKWFSS